MKLLLINGSPRGKKSNTKLLFDHFEQGILTSNSKAQIKTVYLNKINAHNSILEKFAEFEYVIIGFPLCRCHAWYCYEIY